MDDVAFEIMDAAAQRGRHTVSEARLLRKPSHQDLVHAEGASLLTTINDIGAEGFGFVVAAVQSAGRILLFRSA